MHKLVLVIVFTSLISSAVSAQNVKSVAGGMSCKVESNRLTFADEGKAKIYTGYEDSFSEGDELNFSYEVVMDSYWGPVIEIRLDDHARNDIHFIQTYYDVSASYSGDALTAEGLLIGENVFYSRSATSHLKLNRYYKGDYSGIWTQFNSINNSGQVTVLDCRPIRDHISEFLNMALE